jgi:hypothetical protein
MSLRAAHLGIGLCLLLAGCVPEGNVRTSPEPGVVNAPPMVVNPPPDYGTGAIRACIADNRRDYADVRNLYDRARRSNRISLAEAREFNAMDDRLRRYERALARDGLTLAECEHLGREIVREREAVHRMARFDDGVAQCRDDARRAHAEVVRTYQDADRAGRINPNERRQFNDMIERLRRHEAGLARNGMTLGECRQLQSMIADERDVVRRMSRNDPGVGQCRRDNQRAHADVMAMFAEAERSGRITQRERRRFDDLQRRFRSYEDQLRSNGLTLAECQALGRTIASDAREVRQMAGYR